MDLLSKEELTKLAQARGVLSDAIQRNLRQGEGRALAVCGLLANGADLLAEIVSLMRAEHKLRLFALPGELWNESV